MPDPRLHLVAPQSDDMPATCRSGGCPGVAADELGFCPRCRRCYDAQRRHQMRLTAVAIAAIRAAHPRLFALLDRTPPLGDELAAHLAAHIQPSGCRPVGLPLEGLDAFLRTARHGEGQR
jgi:hypothetical protein